MALAGAPGRDGGIRGRREARPGWIGITRLPGRSLVDCELTYVARQPIDYGRALEQHARYREALEGCGVEVRTLPAEESLPDSTFVEDAAIVLDEVAVLCSMGADSRVPEPLSLERELACHREVLRVERPACIDGGDIQRVGRILLVGCTERTDEAGRAALADIVSPHGYEVRPVGVSGCLHLKSGCTALPDGRVLVNPEWIETGALSGFETVSAPPEEPFGADVLTVGERVVAAAEHPRSAEMIERLGFEVRRVEMSEFAKAEAGVTCLSLIFLSG